MGEPAGLKRALDERPEGVAYVHVLSNRVFVRSPGFDTEDEARAWLRDSGVPAGLDRLERGPDGLVRGSGEVTGG